MVLNNYDSRKMEFADALANLIQLTEKTRNHQTTDKALWFIGDSCIALSVYFSACITTSPSDKKTEFDDRRPRLNYDSSSNKCEAWDNLYFYTCTFSIMSLQLAIEEWILSEFGRPEKINPRFPDHYKLILNQIKIDNQKKYAKAFFEALDILRNKSAHRNSNTKITKNELNKLKNGGFDTNQIVINNFLYLTPTICIRIMQIAMDKISEIRTFFTNTQ